MSSGTLTLALADLGGATSAQVGTKAATLGGLMAAGFLVPGGFVLTTRALALALEEGVVAKGAVAEGAAGEGALPEGGVPREVADALCAAYDALGGGPVAVRSSSADEDLPGRSYAGMYDTVLDVTGHDALLDAVRTCWASAFHDRVAAYRGDREPSMAVLVQRMVPAEAAGVAFSANPVTGDRDETLVSVVAGLGERLVSGQATPDEWSVREGRPTRTAESENALGEKEVAAVADLVARVEAWAGVPVDVEWAWYGGAVALLQARPITTLGDTGAPNGSAPPPGFWTRGEYSLKPLSPMNVCTLIQAVNDFSTELFRFAVADRVQVRSIEGWSYVRIALIHEPEAILKRLTRIAAALRADEPWQLVSSWHDTWEPEIAAGIDRAKRTDLAALTDTELLDRLAALHELAAEAQRLHFLVGGASSLVWGELGAFCEELLGWDVAQVLVLVSGTPGKTSEPARELSGLAALARGKPAVRDLLLQEAEADRVLAADPEFAARVRAFMDVYGLRCLGADLAEPTMAERPASLLRLVAAQLEAPGPAAGTEAARARKKAVAEAHARLATSGDDSGSDTVARFERLLERALIAYPLRDDTAFHAHTAWGLFRLGLLETGRRLALRGQISEEADVFMLNLDEVRSAVADGRPRGELVAAETARVAWAAMHMGPQSYGDPPTLPPVAETMAGLDADDHAALAPMRWVDAAYRVGSERPEQSPGVLLRGVAASAGRYTGPVRILVSEADFAKLEPGDVLVCPETTPQWSMLFGSVGALVTDSGGLLSHPAIIAREHGVPAVVATGNATRLLRDGQLVTVDGRAGLVEVLS
ncbi:PEP/pyruvate-binding domain-containing protein [Nonomuraea sp. NPDC049129]|uniref:PEP/pyruvate-binding domain-containing protein n=1 Tax=Nonomuraea sp. NPDC049129 TaxID=3155272 RepID=UPI0033C6F482